MASNNHLLGTSSPENSSFPDSPLPALSAEDYLGILRRRRRVIFTCLGVALLIAGIIAWKTKPVYEATAKLLVDSGAAPTSSIDTTDPIASLMTLSNPQTVETQVAMLQTGPLLSQVATQANVPMAEMATHLTVANIETTNIIEVTANLHSAQAAANSVNLLLQDYLQQQKASDQSNVDSAYAYLTGRKATAWIDLLKAQAALKSYKDSHNLADLDRNRDNVLANAMTLTTNYQTDLSSIAGTQSRIAVEKALLAKEPTAFMYTVHATNTTIQVDKESINRLLEQKASLTQPGGFTENAPAVQAINGQVAQLRREIAAQPALSSTVSGDLNSVRQDLHNRLTQDESNLANLKANAEAEKLQLAATQAEAHNYPGYANALARLDSNVDAARTAYDLYSAKSASLGIRRQTYHPHATIVELATVPAIPVQPKKGQILGFGLGIGLFLGLVTALFLEFMDDKIYSQDEIVLATRFPVLGLIPSLVSRTRGGQIVINPQAENFRWMRANLLLNARHRSLRSFVVTSPASGEGVTTVAINLASAFAEAGIKTVLVDANLRHPAVHSVLQTPRVPGLTELLRGEVTLDDVLLESEITPNLMSITSGAIPEDPTSILQSKPFSDLQLHLSKIAEVVIYDAASVEGGADAQIVASHTDGVIMVVGLCQTKKKKLFRAVETLRLTQTPFLGVCCNALTHAQKKPVVIATLKSMHQLGNAASDPQDPVFRMQSLSPPLKALSANHSAHSSSADTSVDTEVSG